VLTEVAFLTYSIINMGTIVNHWL